MSNATIWTISLIALIIILIGLFTSLVNQGKEVPTGKMVPKLRRKKGGHVGQTEEYEIPNPDFDPDEAESVTNPRMIQATEPVMETIYPNRGVGFMAMLAVTVIMLGAAFTLTHLNSEQGQTAQAAAEANVAATNALATATDAAKKAFDAESKAISAEGAVTLLDQGLKKVYGTTTVTNKDGQVFLIPNYSNVLRKDDVAELLAGIDGRIATESSTRSNDVARIDGRLTELDGKLVEISGQLSKLSASQTAAVTASTDAARRIEALKATMTNDLNKALVVARAEIGRAVDEAKAAAGNRTLPASVIQPMTIPRSDISLAYRRVGMFGKHSAIISYQATLNGRPDMETNTVSLLEKFERDHKAMIVKGLEEAASKKQPANKDKAIVKLSDRIRADFNAWVLGEWDFRKAGPAPQITELTLTKWEIGNNDEE
jgi:hypothetical protein